MVSKWLNTQLLKRNCYNELEGKLLSRLVTCLEMRLLSSAPAGTLSLPFPSSFKLTALASSQRLSLPVLYRHAASPPAMILHIVSLPMGAVLHPPLPELLQNLRTDGIQNCAMVLVWNPEALGQDSQSHRSLAFIYIDNIEKSLIKWILLWPEDAAYHRVGSNHNVLRWQFPSLERERLTRRKQRQFETFAKIFVGIFFEVLHFANTMSNGVAIPSDCFTTKFAKLELCKAAAGDQDQPCNHTSCIMRNHSSPSHSDSVTFADLPSPQLSKNHSPGEKELKSPSCFEGPVAKAQLQAGRLEVG
ncbi:hypothetical protein Nmel_013068 [Mimus melanotis]